MIKKVGDRSGENACGVEEDQERGGSISRKRVLNRDSSQKRADGGEKGGLGVSESVLGFEKFSSGRARNESRERKKKKGGAKQTGPWGGWGEKKGTGGEKPVEEEVQARGEQRKPPEEGKELSAGNGGGRQVGSAKTRMCSLEMGGGGIWLKEADGGGGWFVRGRG